MVVAVNRLLQLFGHLHGLVEVVQFEPDTRGAFHPVNLCGILHMHHGQRGIVFKMPGIKRADHRDLLEPWCHAGGRDLAIGRHQGHRIALLHTHGHRKLLAQHHPEAAGHQLLQSRIVDGRHAGDAGLHAGIDATHHHPAHGIAPHQQRLARHERRRSHHLRMLAHLFHEHGRIGQRLSEGIVYFDVRHHAEHAVAHFLLETIHDRKDHDQRPHAQRDANHRRGRNEGNEAIAPRCAPRPGIPPAYQQFVW